MSYPLRTTAAIAALGVAGAAVWTMSSGDSEQPTIALGRIENIALTTEHDCTDLLKYYRTEATKTVGPYGVNGGPQLYRMNDLGVTADSAASGSAAKAMAPEAASATGSGAPDSGTNVQVAGVDESDVVKTSGNVMVSVINGEVRITRLDGADTKKLADWRPTGGSAQSVLLDRNLAVVIGDSGGIPLGASKLRAPDGIYEAVTELTVLDLTDPAAPRPLRRLELSGTRAGDVRLVDGELRLALNSGPSGIAWKQPVYPKSPNQDRRRPRPSSASWRRTLSRRTRS